MDSETQAFDDEIINEDSGLFIDKKDEEEDEEEDRGYPIAQILWKGNSYYLYQGT